MCENRSSDPPAAQKIIEQASTFFAGYDSEEDYLEIDECYGKTSSSKSATKKPRMKYTDCLDKISMECEWKNCTLFFSKVGGYIDHVAQHLLEQLDECLCFWRDCGTACNSKKELDSHVYFHAFHTKLKAVGAIMINNTGLQCLLDSQSRNMIPDIPSSFQCLWRDCDAKIFSVQHFYWHTQGHAFSVSKEGGTFACQWEDCNAKKKSNCHLREHLRTHTQEKIVGCPNCGGIFAQMAKLKEHLERQTSVESRQYRCSHCSKAYTTLRFLKDHIRLHINHFKCPKCDMTCPTNSVLRKHMKFRHFVNRPFTCSQCCKGFKSMSDLNRHILTHSEQPAYVCDYDGCKYSCRAAANFNKHVKIVHRGVKTKAYACHICDKTFRDGNPLTKHLIKVHNFQWPSGHSRFRYQQSKDGYFKLQTVRYESLELNQELLLQEDQLSSKEVTVNCVNNENVNPVNIEDSECERIVINSKEISSSPFKTKRNVIPVISEEIIHPADY